MGRLPVGGLGRSAQANALDLPVHDPQTGESRKGGHALRIGTPKGFNHCYDTYRDGQPGGEPDHKSWQYTSLQGGNVPADELDAARRKMDPRTFRQEYEAGFENYAGVVYYTFDRAECRTSERIKPGEALHIGMDFNVMKMAAVVYVVRTACRWRWMSSTRCGIRPR